MDCAPTGYPLDIEKIRYQLKLKKLILLLIKLHRSTKKFCLAIIEKYDAMKDIFIKKMELYSSIISEIRDNLNSFIKFELESVPDKTNNLQKFRNDLMVEKEKDSKYHNVNIGFALLYVEKLIINPQFNPIVNYLKELFLLLLNITSHILI